MPDDPLLLDTAIPETLRTLQELARAVRRSEPVYVRYSEGPLRDGDGGSIDTESGIELPGLSVNPLRPEAWWTRPVEDWLARQVCQYGHLRRKNADRFAWILSGREVGRGPDCEPLLRGIRPLARLDERLLDEAERRYRERFRAGHGPED